MITYVIKRRCLYTTTLSCQKVVSFVGSTIVLVSDVILQAYTWSQSFLTAPPTRTHLVASDDDAVATRLLVQVRRVQRTLTL